MARFLKKREKSLNKPPGYLSLDVTHPVDEDVKIHLMDFNAHQMDELLVPDLSSCQSYLQDESTTAWVDVGGLSDLAVIKEVGKVFEIDSLYLEDVLNTDHRPKAEDLDELLFIIIKSVHFDQSERRRIRFEQISLFLGDQFVVSFHENKSSIFDPVKERLRKAKGKVRFSEAAYLFYALVDVVVDNYFSVVEKLGAEIEELDLKMIKSPTSGDLESLNRLKSEILFLRKAILPIRESIQQILRSDRKDISDKTRAYLRDSLDHAIQISEAVESYREMISGLAEVVRTATNRELNEIMKVLTIFTTIFIPLTFVSSIYGMNFEVMPELQWKYGYYMVWAVLLSIAGVMIFFFRKRRWI